MLPTCRPPVTTDVCWTRARRPSSRQARRHRRFPAAPSLQRRGGSDDRPRCRARGLVSELVARAARAREAVAGLQLRSRRVRVERPRPDAAHRRSPHRRTADPAGASRGPTAVRVRRTFVRRLHRPHLRAAIPGRDRGSGARRSGARRGLGHAGAKGTGADRSRRAAVPLRRAHRAHRPGAHRRDPGRRWPDPDRAPAGQGRQPPRPLAAGRGDPGAGQKLPRELRPTLAQFWSKPHFFEALGSQIASVCVSAGHVLEATAGGYGDLPLITISSTDPGAHRLRQQDAMAALSTRGRHIIASQSGHWIPLDQPEVVIDAIKEVVAAARP